MNGVHDMGGLQGFGPVVPEADEPLFHAPWERRALGLTLAAGATGQWNIDQSRSMRESLPPALYLASSYYRIWILALERLVANPPQPLQRVLHAADVDAALACGSPCDRPATQAAAFAVGQRVRARQMHPAGHTRLPRYVRGHVGRVVALHGVHAFADARAASGDQAPQWLYTVEFDAIELWGLQADPRDRVSVEAWEPYLEPAP